MTKWNQLRSALRGRDSSDSGDFEGIALGRFQAPNAAHGSALHANECMRQRRARGSRLSCHVHHSHVALFVVMRKRPNSLCGHGDDVKTVLGLTLRTLRIACRSPRIFVGRGLSHDLHSIMMPTLKTIRGAARRQPFRPPQNAASIRARPESNFLSPPTQYLPSLPNESSRRWPRRSANLAAQAKNARAVASRSPGVQALPSAPSMDAGYGR